MILITISINITITVVTIIINFIGLKDYLVKIIVKSQVRNLLD